MGFSDNEITEYSLFVPSVITGLLCKTKSVPLLQVTYQVSISVSLLSAPLQCV